MAAPPAASPVPPLPPQPNAPINLPPESLALPPHPAAAVPTPLEAVVIRQYVTAMGIMRMGGPSSVTSAELSNWMAYSAAIDGALTAGPGLAAVVTAAVNAGIAPLTQAINNLTGRMDRMEAKIDNLVPQKCNAVAFEAYGNGLDPTNLNLTPLFKSVAGNPPGPAPAAAVAGLLPAGNPIAVGTAMSSPPFPQTVAVANNLGANSIRALQYAYNETFGIVHADKNAQKKEKFLRWARGLQ